MQFHAFFSFQNYLASPPNLIIHLVTVDEAAEMSPIRLQPAGEIQDFFILSILHRGRISLFHASYAFNLLYVKNSEHSFHF